MCNRIKIIGNAIHAFLRQVSIILFCTVGAILLCLVGAVLLVPELILKLVFGLPIYILFDINVFETKYFNWGHLPNGFISLWPFVMFD